MTHEGLKSLRRNCVLYAETIDPNKALFLLLRHITGSWRQRLKGQALLAFRYYEIAEMLGYFLEDLTGEKQKLVDGLEAVDGDWKKIVFGISSTEIDYRQKVLLPSVTRWFGLDPRSRVLFLVEGESEEKYSRKWFELNHINPDALGIDIFPLHGVGSLSSVQTRQHLEKAKSDNAGIFIAVDNEGNARQTLQGFVDAKLVYPIYHLDELKNDEFLGLGAALWNPYFEMANFTKDEILDAILALNNKDLTQDNSQLKNELEEECITFCRNSANSTWVYGILMVSARKFRTPHGKKVELATKLVELYRSSDKPINLLLTKVVRFAIKTRRAASAPPN
jgi:hypothetical protein